jgi:hypothetical protein
MLRFEQAGLEDGPALLSLIEADAAKGAIELFYTRRPSPVASYQRESDFVSLAVLRDDAGRPSIMAADVLHRYFVGGEDREIGYMSGIRRRKDSYPRGNWLHALYAYEREHCSSCLFSVLEDNADVMTFFEKHKPEAVTIAPVCDYNTYMVNPKALLRFLRQDLRTEPVQPGQIDAIYAFLAQHGRQYDFFPAVTDLEKQFSGLHWADCLAVWHGKRVVAFGALWEQTAYRQYIVKAYHGPMQTARVFSSVLEAAGYIPIPPAGEVLKIATLTLMSAAGEDPGIYRALLGGLADMARRRKMKILVIGLPKPNYQSDIFQTVRHLSFGSHIYMLQDTGEPPYSAGRQPLHLECGWL